MNPLLLVSPLFRGFMLQPRRFPNSVTFDDQPTRFRAAVVIELVSPHLPGLEIRWNLHNERGGLLLAEETETTKVRGSIALHSRLFGPRLFVLFARHEKQAAGQTHVAWLRQRQRKKVLFHEFYPDARNLEGRGDTSPISQHQRGCHTQDFKQ